MTTVAAAGTRRAAPRRRALAFAYAALFAGLLPLLLVEWMLRLDRILALPPAGSPPVGVGLLLGGTAFVAAGVFALWRDGGGLPMSPFPPPRLATRGAYALVSDPIYVGSALSCAGVAAILGSPAGLWIVTPVFVASMAAFVDGYEREATRERLGAGPQPLLRMPDDVADRPSPSDRLAVYVLVIVPWLVFGQVHLPAYPIVLLAPLVPATRSDLRRFALDGVAAAILVTACRLLIPVAPLPTHAVVWACIAGAAIARRWPRARVVAIGLAGAAGAGSAFGGTHGVAHVLAAYALWGLVATRRSVWFSLCRAAEAVANSWGERTLGPVRFLSHGVYAGVGAAAGVALAATMAGAGSAGWLIGLALAAELGAAIWAQVVEGSLQLLRPYGYFGAVTAVVVAAPVAWAVGADPWLLLAAFSVGACVTQAFGRVRCLVQGCCHGRRVDAAWGIRYRHPRSRVLRLSALGGLPVHPTQLYSILASAAVCACLVRLWMLAAPLSLVVGSYLVLTGLARFVEEHYRGEPQTARVGGLRLYQWLAMAFVFAGAAITTVGGPSAPPPTGVPGTTWVWLSLLGLLTYAAYGVDFPGSNRRFSRLV